MVEVRSSTKPLAYPVHGQYRLLLDALDRDEAHPWPAHRLAYRLSIIAVVLPVAPIGRDELRCHQTNRMAEGLEATRPLVCATTCLHSNQTRR